MAYKKQTWVDNETIVDAARMEHIEEGILAAEKLAETKMTNPETGTVGQILEVETVDKSGKPLTFKTVDKPKNEADRKEIMPQTSWVFTLNSTYGAYAWFGNVGESPVAFEEGKTYIVIWDGTEYTLTTKTAEMGGMVGYGVGNLGLLGLGENTGEPFAIAYSPDYVQLMAFSDDTEENSHTVSIYLKTIIGLPEVTTDDNGKHLVVENGEWVAKEFEATGGSERVILIEEQERVLYLFDYFGKYGYSFDTIPFIPVVGETYIVVWEGTEYTCTAQTITMGTDSGIAIGNGGVLGSTDDTGEPFLISYAQVDAEMFICFSATDTEQVARTFGVYQNTSIKELPAVTDADNGKVLGVVGGAWGIMNIPSGGGSSSDGSSGGGFAIEEIWANENTSAAFTYQRINFEKSYKLFIVDYLVEAGKSSHLSTIIYPHDRDCLLTSITGHYGDYNDDGVQDSYCYYASRNCNAVENSIYIGNSSSFKFGSVSAMNFSDNTRNVPYKIYGIS